ncbi:unnamed protein product [Mytilus edulis]|uniref:Uncharacterized protein n=1 Tax=Mytilus edulis TaxID=6550 RepID=A0A8S3VGZ9_MYTED|nr:unnamed protein product [Mytilus edulis]
MTFWNVYTTNMTTHICVNVEQGTIGQRDNPEWQKHRKCRITASVISNIMKCNFNQLTSNHYLVKKNFLGTSISFRSDATEFGINMEKVAKTQYFDRMSYMFTELTSNLLAALPFTPSHVVGEQNVPSTSTSADNISNSTEPVQMIFSDNESDDSEGSTHHIIT